MSTSLVVIGKAALGEVLTTLALEGLREIDFRLDAYVKSIRKRESGEINANSGCTEEGQDLRQLD